MGKKHRLLIRLLTAVFCLALLLPLPVSAADLYFTSVNDNLLPLTSDTMPVWSGSQLYVPYTIFDSSTNSGIDLGLYCSYNRDTGSLAFMYSTSKFLVFNVKTGTCRDELTGETYSARAIMRNGRPYVPVNTVCSFFGLEWSYTSISQGYLVRIKSDAVVLSDAKFIDAASGLINRRLREYNQSLNPTPDPAAPTIPSVTPPQNEDDPSSASVRTYLAFLCQAGGELDGVLDALDSQGKYALFLMTPQALEENSGLVRRILGTGHSIGILAEGDDPQATRALLEAGNQILEQNAHIRTTLARVPKDQRALLESEGWVCWNETLSLSPTDTVGAGTFASNTMRRLEGRTRTTYLTLPGTANTGRVLTSLLRQLENNHFVVSTPLETRL